MSSTVEARFEPIAERRVAAAGQPERHAIILIGKPYRDVDPSGDWICPVQLRGIGDERIIEVHGLDAVQALLLALEKARIDLTNLAPDLTWEGGQWPGDNGIPRAVPHFYGRDFAERVGRIVDVEIERLGEAAEARASRGEGNG